MKPGGSPSGPSSGSAASILDTVRQLGFLQIDPISTVAPPQQLVLWSRLGPYSLAELDRLLWEDKKLFEWAAYIWPIEDLVLIRARMRRRRGKNSYERQGSEFLPGSRTGGREGEAPPTDPWATG